MNAQELLDELQNLDLQEPGRWSAPIRYGLAGLLFLLIAIGSAYYVHKQKQPVIEQAKTKEINLRKDFERKQKKAVNLEAYKKQLADMEIAFKGMLNQLPSKTELDELIIDISTAILTSGLDEQEFKRQNEATKDFYAEVPVNIVAEGDYHQMADFVSKVAALPRIVTLHDFSIEPASGASNNTRGRQRDNGKRDLNMKIVAKTYRYLDEDELEEAENGK